MSSKKPSDTIDIQPEVAIYKVFRHLNYKPWYALAELVDNALQSYLSNRAALQRVEGKGAPLRVEIEFDRAGSQRLIIRDNAAGIDKDAWEKRAFRAGHPPPASEALLSEFGVGLKTAASWFAQRWSVRSGALGEDVARELTFDVDEIILKGNTLVATRLQRKDPDVHFTEVILQGLHNPLQTRTLAKMKDYLASIYRFFLRDGELDLVFDGESLEFEEPVILIAPPHDNQKAAAITWRKPIDIKVGSASVTGTAWILATASTSTAGFSLFRNRRLIEGIGDEKFRPPEIFGAPNSFVFQRLGGELSISGIEVSHTKDGFKWGELEQDFLQALHGALNEAPLPMLKQARGHRARPKSVDVQPAADKALGHIAEVMDSHVEAVLNRHMQAPAAETSRALPPKELPRAKPIAHREINLDFKGTEWTVRLELTLDPAISDWYAISQRPGGNAKSRHMGVRVSLDHPFVNQFGSPDQTHIEPLVRIAVALALAETTAREAGIKDPGEVRIIVNDLLRTALWHPGGGS